MSVILKILESEAGTRKNTPNLSEKIESTGEFPWEKTIPFEIKTEEICIGKGKRKILQKARTLQFLSRDQRREVLIRARGIILRKRKDIKTFFERRNLLARVGLGKD